MNYIVGRPMRWLALRAPVRQMFTRRHLYLSTACLAGEHDYCQAMVGARGQKLPGVSKFSGAVCICPVCDHGDGPQ